LSIRFSEDARFLFSPQTGDKGNEIFVNTLRERSKVTPYRHVCQAALTSLVVELF
jgi:hypothetical protein